MNSSSEPNRETPALAALPNLVIVCEHPQAGSSPDAGSCKARAQWAIRTHGMALVTGCPRVMLLCDTHLHQAQSAYARIWEQLSHAPTHLHICVTCRQPIRDLDCLIWGIERIAS
jgi:hypothetical protein